MKIYINGLCYTSLSEMRGKVKEDIVAFVEEWYNKDTCVIGYTSGSTGKPKEIRLNKEDMRASARITNERLGIQPESVLFLCLSVSYIAGKMMVVRALEAGAKLITGEVTSRPLMDWGRPDVKIDLAAMVPMQLEETLKYSEDRKVLTGIRQLLVGGAPVSAKLEKRIGDISTICYATYGMTETVSHVALRQLNKDDCYFALGKISFSTDERGCLVIYTPHLHAGKFVTNDLVELIDKWHFRWLGRYDHVINSGGIKFFPEVIEEKITSCISVRYFITSLPDERLGQRIVLVLEGKPGKEIEKMQLFEKLRFHLTSYEMPREILYLPYFYETDSGKIIRRLS